MSDWSSCMKKKTVITASTLLLLTVGGVTALNVINPSWRENTIFATARDKQSAWLKAHEKEIVAWIHSRYPKIESVQFDWNTLEVGAVSNGIFAESYNLSVKGTFNNNQKTIIFIDFRLEHSDSIPKMSRIGMNHHPRIEKDGVYYIFE